MLSSSSEGIHNQPQVWACEKIGTTVSLGTKLYSLQAHLKISGACLSNLELKIYRERVPSSPYSRVLVLALPGVSGLDETEEGSQLLADKQCVVFETSHRRNIPTPSDWLVGESHRRRLRSVGSESTDHLEPISVRELLTEL